MDKRVAIEHTSIDFLPHQRRDDARFDEIFGLLEKEFRTRSEFSGCISISFGAMPSGVNWDAVREALRKWISREVPSLDNGTTEHHIDGVPFSIRVRKPSSISQLWFAREATDDSKFADRLLNLVHKKGRS
ncbi:MAG TPA: hypothetical protein VN666_13740 [Nitrospira sp.]|nr:hypothetical protein [Nitrospira sp.]